MNQRWFSSLHLCRKRKLSEKKMETRKKERKDIVLFLSFSFASSLLNIMFLLSDRFQFSLSLTHKTQCFSIIRNCHHFTVVLQVNRFVLTDWSNIDRSNEKKRKMREKKYWRAIRYVYISISYSASPSHAFRHESCHANIVSCLHENLRWKWWITFVCFVSVFNLFTMYNAPHSTQPSAPPLYPSEAAEYLRPVPPVRSEFAGSRHDDTLLPPKVPKRMDIPSTNDRPMSRRSLDNAVDAGIRRVNIFSCWVMREQRRMIQEKKTMGFCFFLVGWTNRCKSLLIEKKTDITFETAWT